MCFQIQYLLEEGAQIDSRCAEESYRGSTPLLEATSWANIPAMEMLLTHTQSTAATSLIPKVVTSGYFQSSEWLCAGRLMPHGAMVRRHLSSRRGSDTRSLSACCSSTGQISRTSSRAHPPSSSRKVRAQRRRSFDSRGGRQEKAGLGGSSEQTGAAPAAPSRGHGLMGPA